MQEDLDYTKISSHGLIQKRLIEYAFTTCTRATNKEEPIADFTHQTGFVRAVVLLKSMLWKYTPNEIRTNIEETYKALAINFEEIDKIDASKLSETNKRSTKQKLEDNAAMSVLELLIIVLQYSPSNVELRSMNVSTELIPEIAKTIKTTKTIKLFPDSSISMEKISEETE